MLVIALANFIKELAVNDGFAGYAQGSLTGIALILSALVYNTLKAYCYRTSLFNKIPVYILTKVTELSIIVVAGVLTQESWVHCLVIFPLFIISITKGTKYGLLSLAYCVILLVPASVLFEGGLHALAGTAHFEFLVSFYIILLVFIVMCGIINKSLRESGFDREKLMWELEEKYEQLAVAQDEIKYHYNRLRDTNARLEETNKKLTDAVAEFYTLQQITQAISSLFDIKELLKFVNDVILGVMGVNNSTIILYDNKESTLKVNTTSISNSSELELLKSNTNCGVLKEVLESGKSIMENNVDREAHVFAKGREVSSLICIPLYTKARKYGLVLVEHKHAGAFDKDNVRLLETIGQQVGIALENAGLYQKMQELATIDGLTGIYNRLYFQERLEKEFREAELKSYPLSLAIFDIDFFKKINDTYGHIFGDKVLKNISERVKASIGKNDLLARFGGEEFILMFPNTTLAQAVDKVELLRLDIEKTPIRDNLVTACITVSFGVSSYPQSAVSHNELLKTADNALYDAKAAGRNCVRCAKCD